MEIQAEENLIAEHSMLIRALELDVAFKDCALYGVDCDAFVEKIKSSFAEQYNLSIFFIDNSHQGICPPPAISRIGLYMHNSKDEELKEIDGRLLTIFNSLKKIN